MRTPAVYSGGPLLPQAYSKVLLLRGAGLGTPTQGNRFAGARRSRAFLWGGGRGRVKVQRKGKRREATVKGGG